MVAMTSPQRQMLSLTKGIPMNTPALSTLSQNETTHRRWNRTAAVLLAAMGIGSQATGCSQEYLIRGDHLAVARAAVDQGILAKQIAVPAIDSTGRESYRRYDRLPSVPLVPPDQKVIVRSKDSRAQRIGGVTLFTLGALHLFGLGIHAAVYASNTARCSRNPYCMNEDFSLLLTGPLLGSIGLSLAIPGAVLMGQGYGAPRDVRPRRFDFLYADGAPGGLEVRR